MLTRAAAEQLFDLQEGAGWAPRSGTQLTSRKRPARKNAVRLLPSGSGWLRAKCSSRIAAFSKIVG
jgi:hypothetical protein